MPRAVLAAIVCWASLLSLSSADASEEAAPEQMRDVRPPIGVVGGTVFSKGKVTFSYRYERTSLEGWMDSDDELPFLAIASRYPVVPTKQVFNSHVFELTWTPFEEVTFLFTLPYEIIKLDQLYQGNRFASESQGLGDVGVMLLYEVYEDRRSRTHLTLGLTFPSGSIDETDFTPVSPGELQRLPYSMQLGSGTVDLQFGFTYNGSYRGTYWGGQLAGTLRAGTNPNNYKRGNAYGATAWAGQRWFSWLATSFRLDWQQKFNVNGLDPLLDPTLSPLNDPGQQGARRLDALFGLDLYFDGGGLEGTRLSIEAGLPAYQNLDGPQLATDWLVDAGFRYEF